MSQTFWEIKTLNISPYQGTTIFGYNEGDEKRIFVKSNYRDTLYIKLWCDSYTEEAAEINPYGVGGFYVPVDYQHRQVQIGTSTDGEDWHWTVHNYQTGWTS